MFITRATGILGKFAFTNSSILFQSSGKLSLIVSSIATLNGAISSSILASFKISSKSTLASVVVVGTSVVNTSSSSSVEGNALSNASSIASLASGEPMSLIVLKMACWAELIASPRVASG